MGKKYAIRRSIANSDFRDTVCTEDLPIHSLKRGAEMVDISGRRETAGTAPAWQVRESQRQRLLEEIKRKIIDLENEIERDKLNWFLLYTLEGKLRRPKKMAFPPETILVIPGWPREHTTRARKLFLVGIEGAVNTFKRSEEEGSALFAKLFEWVAQGIVHSYSFGLRRQETENPTLILGTACATDEIQFE